jgi:hypothetical protein
VRPVVTVEVVVGSLSQADAPLLFAGRYRRLPFAGPAEEFDYLLKSWLTRALELGMIGSGLGELFRIPLSRLKERNMVKADDLFLVGMGEPGRLNADDARYLMTNVTVAAKAMLKPTLATHLFGARRSELPPAVAARAFAQGVADGYERCQSMLDSMGSEEREVFHDVFFGDLHVVLVEADAAKARDIARAFDQLGKDPTFRTLIQVRVCGDGTKTIPVLKMDRHDRADDTLPGDDRLTLLHISCPVRRASREPGPKDPAPSGSVVLQYAALSDTASLPVRNQEANPYFFRALPGRMIQAATVAEQESLGQLWANYLVPTDFHAVIHGSTHLTVVLDEKSAAFPWEMVALPGHKSTQFLGTDFQLTRVFRTLAAEVRGVPPPLNRMLRVLVIADPASGDLALPFARREGLAVVEAINHAQELWKDHYTFEVTARIGPDQRRDDDDLESRVRAAGPLVVKSFKRCEPLELLTNLVNAETTFDVVHYAGHGEFDEDRGRMGWRFDDDCVLSANEIFRVRQVPRLVFANACFSAATSGHRQRQRVGLAQAFFARGIKDFIGTGWEVQDDSAEQLAAHFYRQVLGIVPGTDKPYDRSPPATLGFALASARRAIMGQGRTTWGAYQHYGQANSKLLAFHNLPD